MMNTAEYLLSIIENSSEAILALDTNLNVVFWNKGAEELFGYQKRHVLGKHVSCITKGSIYEFETALKRAKDGRRTTFKTQKFTHKGDVLDLMVTTSPIYEGDRVLGLTIVVHELQLIKKARYITQNLTHYMREPKRTFNQIRNSIIFCLVKGRKTINQISVETNINWKTVEKHLTYLIGKKLVEEIFTSEYVRIFELTKSGEETARRLAEEEISRYVERE